MRGLQKTLNKNIKVLYRAIFKSIAMSQARSLSRKWSRDEDRALLDMTVQAGENLSSRWAMIAAEMEVRFPGRRLYTPSSVKQHYNGLNLEGSGGQYWTRQERQTLLILCQDNDDAVCDWVDIAEQMQMIFDDKKKFTVELVRRRYQALTKRANDDELKKDGRRRSLETSNPPKRKRSESLIEAIRPAIVLGCDDGEFVPVYEECDAGVEQTVKTLAKDADERTNGLRSLTESNRASNQVNELLPMEMVVYHGDATFDKTLRIAHEYIEQHMQALRKTIKLIETCPDSLNEAIRNLEIEALSDDECDMIVQWSVACDSNNSSRWLEYARHCDVNDRQLWPVIVPQCTLYVIQLIASGRVAIVPERVQSDMDRLHIRLRQLYLRKHSPLYRLVANQEAALPS